jgi:type II secretory pathway predicted ATPase ExeA/cytoskeletal protein CcmA (bactofilin family)
MDNESGSKIGPGMVVRGELSCNGKLRIAGDLEGTIVGGDLVIESEGRVCGIIEGQCIDCSGRLEGKIVAQKFILRRGACHVGTVVTDELSVETGAVLDCALQSGNVVRQEFVRSKPAITEQVSLPKLSGVVDAFTEENRPSCMDIPWAGRAMLLTNVIELLAKRKPLIKIVGETGSGKSTFADKLLEINLSSFAFYKLDGQSSSVLEFMQRVAGSLQIPVDLAANQAELLAKVSAAVMARRDSGQRTVLVIDEAQELFPATLEGIIHQLTNACDENSEELLQMILLGTEGLEEKMVVTIREYFADETNCQLELEPLTIKDTAQYLRLGLQQAVTDGTTVHLLLPYETIKAIHQKSRGNIQLINQLMSKAVGAAIQANATQITTQFV